MRVLLPTLVTAATLLACNGVFSFEIEHVFDEQEPNDDIWNPQDVGFLYTNGGLTIIGTISFGTDDPYDGYAITASLPMEVEVRLDAYIPGVDLDFCVYDPISMTELACFEGADDPQVGRFVIDGPLLDNIPFHVVVTSAAGSSGYNLEVESLGPPEPSTSSAASSRSAGSPSQAFAGYLPGARGALDVRPFPGEITGPGTLVEEPDGSRLWLEVAGEGPPDR